MRRRIAVVVGATLLVGALLIAGVILASASGPHQTPPPYESDGTGRIIGSISSIGTDQRPRGKKVVTYRVFSVRWGSALWPRESQFLITDRTRLALDGKTVSDSASRAYATLLKDTSPGRLTVEYRKSAAAPIAAESPGQDYAYAEALSIEVEAGD